MSEAIASADDGIPRLPRDLTEDELSSMPVLRSVDELLIENLTDEEDDAFSAALDP